MLILAAAGLPYQVILVGLMGAPSTTDIGYQPEQPIAYSHELHVNQLGMDCRYCHTTVEKTGFAAIPSANVCMNCHHAIRPGSPEIQKLRQRFYAKDPITNQPSALAGMPVEWVKVHDLPDYSYFDHSAHINRGVSCVSCHGRVDHIGAEGVWQQEELSMGWCLNCHRDPTPNLRPRDQITNLRWGLNLSEEEAAQIRAMGVEVKAGDDLTDDQRRKIGEFIRQANHVNSLEQGVRKLTDCSTCHR